MKKILVIQKKMIGDVLTSTILFEYLRNKYGESCVLHYLVDRGTFSVLDNNPYIDKVIAFEGNNFTSLLREVRKEQYTDVIDVYSTLKTAILSFLSGAKFTIGYHKKYTQYLYKSTYKRKSKSILEVGLAIENRLGLVSSLGIDYNKQIVPKIYLSGEERKASLSFLKQHDVFPKDSKLYMISILGSEESKTYPFDYMAKILDTIVSNSGEKVVLLFNYIPSQLTEVEKIYALCKDATKQRVKLEVYGKSLREFLGLLSCCNGIIGNEGGAINMAKALDIPTFSIFSPWIKKESWSLYEDGIKNVSVHVRDYDFTELNELSSKELKQNVNYFYKRLKPELFNEELRQFVSEK